VHHQQADESDEGDRESMTLPGVSLVQVALGALHEATGDLHVKLDALAEIMQAIHDSERPPKDDAHEDGER
jgi:hypothetical protein